MILVTQHDDQYEIRFGYDAELVELVKNVPGRVWNPQGKFWTIPLARLGFLIAQLRGTKYEQQLVIQSAEDLNVNASINEPNQIPNIDISDVTQYVQDGFKLFAHQIDMLKFAKWRYLNGLRSGFILADAMGCIAGNQFVRIRENDNAWTREATLSNVYMRFKAGNRIRIRTLGEEGRFVYKPVANVIDKGIKHVIKIRTNSHELICTPDHEILTPSGWVSAEHLSVGDKVLMNGKIKFCYNKAIFTDDMGNEVDPVCPRCHSKENIVRERGSKYLGYCRRCMYKLRSGRFKDTDSTIYKHVDSDGYVKLQGYPIRFSPVYERYNNGEGIYEHHQVWYEHTGHVVDTSIEAIHHKNHIKTDNRIENLELLKLADHYRAHLAESLANLPQNHTDAQYYYAHGKKVMLIPAEETVTDIEDNAEECHVYDVTIDDPVVHNFVCNHFIVHNCGKTLQVLNWAMYLKEHYNAKHCLIIACVNSAKYNWRADIIKHTNGKEEPYILGSRLKRDGSINFSTGSQEKLEDLTTLKMYGGKGDQPLPYFIILNIEAVRMRIKKLYPIANRLAELANNGEISLIALDEVHRNCLEYNTLVHTAEGEMKIGEIVKHRLKVNVLSYDVGSDKLVYMPVVDWHAAHADFNLIELTIQEGDRIRIVKCTHDHQFFTRNRGWVAASNLTEYDDIVFKEGTT